MLPVAVHGTKAITQSKTTPNNPTILQLTTGENFKKGQIKVFGPKKGQIKVFLMLFIREKVFYVSLNLRMSNMSPLNIEMFFMSLSIKIGATTNSIRGNAVVVLLDHGSAYFPRNSRSHPRQPYWTLHCTPP